MTAKTRSKLPPTKSELANFKVMSEQGYSPNAIGKMSERDPKTVRKYLQSDVYNNPDLENLCAEIRKKEREDLELIGAKCRAKLHELIPKATQIIPVVAAMDRSFQQVRLLGGNSTKNISLIQEYYAKACASKPRDIKLVQRNVENLPRRMASADPEEPAS